MSPFGRDVLTAAWQAGPLSPDMMKGALPELARWQGSEENAWRDEQPGKLLHEAHDRPTKVLNYNSEGEEVVRLSLETEPQIFPREMLGAKRHFFLNIAPKLRPR